MTISKAMQAAIAEGLSVFFASTHVGGRYEFLANNWEEGGFSVDSEGNPKCDAAGNTVARYSVRPIDRKIDADLCREWYG